MKLLLDNVWRYRYLFLFICMYSRIKNKLHEIGHSFHISDFGGQIKISFRLHIDTPSRSTVYSINDYSAIVGLFFSVYTFNLVMKQQKKLLNCSKK